MVLEFLLPVLLAGVPYYVFFEETALLSKDKIFLFAAGFLTAGLLLAVLFEQRLSTAAAVIALAGSVYTLYKASATTNLYKIAYYLLFLNAPMMIMFQISNSFFYGVCLLISATGLFLVGKFYEKSYGSANYRCVSGITLVTPYAGLVLTVYLTALALYPPFPNALLFLNVIMQADIGLLWYVAVVVIFFGNFLIAVRVMAKTVFGKPNPNVHYIDFGRKQKAVHAMLFILLAAFTAFSIGELL